MPDSSSSPSTAVTSAPTMSDKNKAESNKRNNDVLIDLGDITPHNIKVLKKVNQVIYPVCSKLGYQNLKYEIVNFKYCAYMVNW